VRREQEGRFRLATCRVCVLFLCALQKFVGAVRDKHEGVSIENLSLGVVVTNATIEKALENLSDVDNKVSRGANRYSSRSNDVMISK
jgi:hypothetical protein